MFQGPFDAYSSPLDTGDSHLVATGLPGCPYRITSYTGLAVADTNPVYGMQLHHPRFLEFIGAPESARLLYHSPMFWIRRLGEEDAMAAAINLQRDAGVLLSNMQVLGRICLIWGWDVWCSLRRRSQLCLRRRGRLGRPSTWPRWLYGVLRPGPVPASSCKACMTCRYCFPEGPLPPGK